MSSQLIGRATPLGGLGLATRKPATFGAVSTPSERHPVESDAMATVPPARVRAPMPSDSALGRKVRELRRSRGLTQKELASAVGVTGAQLHRYETGATRVAASRMIAIAEALGVRPDVLLGSAAPEVPAPAPAEATTGDDLLELIQLFSAIGDPKNRNAVLAIARMMAAPNPNGGSGS